MTKYANDKNTLIKNFKIIECCCPDCGSTNLSECSEMTIKNNKSLYERTVITRPEGTKLLKCENCNCEFWGKDNIYLEIETETNKYYTIPLYHYSQGGFIKTITEIEE